MDRLTPLSRTCLCRIRWLCSGLLDLLFPPRCAVCSRLGSPYLCDRCIAAFEPVPLPVCRVCGSPTPVEHVDAHAHQEYRSLCMTCRHQNEFHFTSARAAGVFDGALRLAIHRLKYEDREGLGRLLGGWARRAGGKTIMPATPPDIVVPVPLHWTRARERGFNQSLLIAEGFVGDLAWPIIPSALRRTRRTRPQVDLDASKRGANVAGAFAVTNPRLVEGRRVMLVDDVLTTLHTVNECARVLVEAGATEVYVVAVAR